MIAALDPGWQLPALIAAALIVGSLTKAGLDWIDRRYEAQRDELDRQRLKADADESAAWATLGEWFDNPPAGSPLAPPPPPEVSHDLAVLTRPRQLPLTWSDYLDALRRRP